MTNPQKELEGYLKILTRKLSFIKAYQNQLSIIIKWKNSKGYPAIKKGAFFFLLVVNSFNNTILLELYKLTSPKESTSIFDWLNKAKENRKALIFNKCNVIKTSEYEKLVSEHLSKLKEIEDTIIKLQARRDKFLAHSDKKYFTNPEKLIEDFPISTEDILSLIDTIHKILHRHYSLFFQTDIDTNVYSSSNVDSILRNVLSFSKVWRDQKLIELGIRPGDYLINEEDLEFKI
ncbi:MAG: hypothetical protein KAW92_05155 [Candidatus Cloacimonetes bacterium]|nr:hypothetical protein [Candidatus Cloacimonadota bacterium]